MNRYEKYSQNATVEVNVVNKYCPPPNADRLILFAGSPPPPKKKSATHDTTEPAGTAQAGRSTSDRI
ncbi:hypothetical protein QUB70_13230 [Microcoleus sp. A003_D6]|uniref:hypothetical protein n=1 Tax=Microcoleus sp. A003_D6 TaxID=3055266 RepID=UPI002FD576DB